MREENASDCVCVETRTIVDIEQKMCEVNTRAHGSSTLRTEGQTASTLLHYYTLALLSVQDSRPSRHT
jgi:hypothetical protein